MSTIEFIPILQNYKQTLTDDTTEFTADDLLPYIKENYPESKFAKFSPFQLAYFLAMRTNSRGDLFHYAGLEIAWAGNTKRRYRFAVK